MSKIEEMREALTRIAEGNLGDYPWQANYSAIKRIAIEALAQPMQPVQEPVGYTDQHGTAYAIKWSGKLPPNLTLYTTPHQTKPLTEHEPVGNEWTPCMKLPVVVHVRKQRPGEAHVSTRAGITPVKTDDLIMRGVSGEEYPIGRAIFEQTYSVETTQPLPKPQPEQEPKCGAIIEVFGKDWRLNYMSLPVGEHKLYTQQYTYTAPPQPKPQPEQERPWVGLTAEEIEYCDTHSHGNTAWMKKKAFARAIEVKLREKNT